MEKQDKRLIALTMLNQKAIELGRLPKRSDFEPQEVCLIKQKLGPWPRALEESGLKAAQSVSSAEKSRMKRQRRKRLMKESKKMPSDITEEEKT